MLKIKKIEIGEGCPKICIPIMGKTFRDMQKDVNELAKPFYNDVHIVEWRADYYDYIANENELAAVLRLLNESLKKKIILFTLRTKKEGGVMEIEPDLYYDIIERAINSGLADVVDIELSADEYAIKKLVKLANEKDVKVLMSYHDFEKTPPSAAIIKKLCAMQKFGADITKAALMPKTLTDVVTVFETMTLMKDCYADKPFVVISMGNLGTLTRIAGETFGSSITFASLAAQSAPGQLSYADLRNTLSMLSGKR